MGDKTTERGIEKTGMGRSIEEGWGGTVLRIHEDDFEVLVCGILINPIRVQNSQIGAFSANTFFCRRTQRTLILELVHTLVCLSSTPSHKTSKQRTSNPQQR